MTGKTQAEQSFEPASGPLIDKGLIAAVPMWMIELHQKPIDWLQKRAQTCSKVIAEKGDVLMYGSKTKGAAGECFNKLAEGIACLLLITRHPVPFGRLVFLPDGDIKQFESEAEANAFVWPKEVAR
jgi:hypothetical protein